VVVVRLTMGIGEGPKGVKHLKAKGVPATLESRQNRIQADDYNGSGDGAPDAPAESRGERNGGHVGHGGMFTHERKKVAPEP
jgi:hypothetical protein